MMRIVVIGGTGRVGANVVRRLVFEGHDAVPASPSTGVDTVTGKGLAEVMTGTDVVVAADDVAATVAELATGAPVEGRVELGGPEALGIDAWARRLFAATGDERTVVSDLHARYFGTELKAGELTPGDGARIGATDFDTWFPNSELGRRS